MTLRDLRRTRTRTVTAKYFLDATELGDLLPLTKTEFVTGAESRAQTGEVHAAEMAEPANNQSFTFCFAMDHLEAEDHTIDKPDDYATWRSSSSADAAMAGPVVELGGFRTENPKIAGRVF